MTVPFSSPAGASHSPTSRRATSAIGVYRGNFRSGESARIAGVSRAITRTITAADPVSPKASASASVHASAAAFAEAADLAARDLDPSGDLHASPAYRRKVAGVCVKRALARATARALESK